MAPSWLRIKHQGLAHRCPPRGRGLIHAGGSAAGRRALKIACMRAGFAWLTRLHDL